MRIFLTGATGFIGTPLVRALYERGDECVVVSRSGRDPWRNERVRVLEADPVILGAWRDQLSGVDVVVNLAGERIVDPPHRWTVERKHRLFESRVATTRNPIDRSFALSNLDSRRVTSFSRKPPTPMAPGSEPP